VTRPSCGLLGYCYVRIVPSCCRRTERTKLLGWRLFRSWHKIQTICQPLPPGIGQRTYSRQLPRARNTQACRSWGTKTSPSSKWLQRSTETSTSNTHRSSARPQTYKSQLWSHLRVILAKFAADQQDECNERHQWNVEVWGLKVSFAFAFMTMAHWVEVVAFRFPGVIALDSEREQNHEQLAHHVGVCHVKITLECVKRKPTLVFLDSVRRFIDLFKLTQN